MDLNFVRRDGSSRPYNETECVQEGISREAIPFYSEAHKYKDGVMLILDLHCTPGDHAEDPRNVVLAESGLDEANVIGVLGGTPQMDPDVLSQAACDKKKYLYAFQGNGRAAVRKQLLKAPAPKADVLVREATPLNRLE